MFLRDLTEYATSGIRLLDARREYDLVIWDNRSTMHRARRFDSTEARDVSRTTLGGDAATIELVA